jgi:hypothetical protein
VSARRALLVCGALLATLPVVVVSSALADPPRTFEQVTPADNGAYGVVSPQQQTAYPGTALGTVLGGESFGKHLEPLDFVSGDGTQVVYSSTGAIAGADPNGYDTFRASRGVSGWSTTWVSPHTPASTDALLFDMFEGASADGSTVTFSPETESPNGAGVSLDSADPTTVDPNSPNDLYQESGPRSSEWISRGPQPAVSEYPVPPHSSGSVNGDILDGISADGKTVVWESPEAIMPGQLDKTFVNIYERSNGVTTRVTVTSAGTSPETGSSYIVAESNTSKTPSVRTQHAVSLDGSRIFFLSPEQLTPQAPSDGSTSLYLRSGNQTILVAAGSDRAPVNPMVVGYEDATPDGSHVYYTRAPGRGVGEVQAPYQLYDYNVGTQTTSLVSADQSGNPSSDPTQTVGYVTSSADGSHVYFVSEAPLDPANQGPMQQNYGLFERVGGASGHTRFIASLSELGGFKGCEAGYGGGNGCPIPVYSARASRDGSRLFFTTATHLTEDDQRPATDSKGKPLFDVYAYDDTTGQIVRVSQGPAGGNGPYSATMGILPLAFYGSHTSPLGVDPRDITPDAGRVFFSTAERLTLDAADNGKIKIYQWQNGATTLVSPSDAGGASPADAIYADNSTDGSNVFFSTTDSLSCGDTDGGESDIYDARIGGTAATCPQPPVPCQATNTCAAVALEPALTPASSLFSGPGNQPVLVNRLTGSKTTTPTRAQKLAKALKVCRKKPHKQRRACESRARKSYGNKVKPKKSSSHPGASGRASR